MHLPLMDAVLIDIVYSVKLELYRAPFPFDTRVLYHLNHHACVKIRTSTDTDDCTSLRGKVPF